MTDQSDPRSDDRLREDAVTRLRANPILDISRIALTVSGREVALNGTVDSDHSRRLAEDLIRATPGVTQVINNLGVQEASHTSISGTGSGIAEGGATSDAGRISPEADGTIGTASQAGSKQRDGSP
ncbi:MAG: BON domain-containing protein [Pseudomonadota bacterium]|nr:BON domain-containing protein [Pseudomonadota bacterium]